MRVGVLSLGAVVASVLVSPVQAGAPQTGDDIVGQAEVVLGFFADEFDTGVAGFRLACAERLAELDENGASDTRLQAYADRCLVQLGRLEARQSAKVNRLARGSFRLLANLDEPGLIQQITDVDSDRDAALTSIEDDTDAAQVFIEDALAAELLD